MAQPAHRSSAERLWFVLGAIAVVVLVVTSCLALFGASGNWFTPIAMVCLLVAATINLVYLRRRRRNDDAHMDDTSEDAPSV